MIRSDSRAPFFHENVFVKCWSLFGLTLFAVTWRLWIPQNAYPQVPLVEWLIQTPKWFDWIALTAVLFSLAVIFFARNTRIQSVAMLFFFVAMIGLILVDQHRMQPWAWQFSIFALLMGIAGPRQSVYWLRLIVISIYLYSAISKFDYQFVHTVGQEFLSTLAGFFGVSLNELSPTARILIAGIFPVGELLVGIGLLIPKLRRIAVVMAVTLHCSLLIVLGPLGLGHQAGVLVWNLFFIFQAVLFFWSPNRVISDAKAAPCDDREIPPSQQPCEAAARSPKSVWQTATVVLATFVILFPVTESFGLCDHWLAWDLYSPRSSRVYVYIDRSAADKLDASAREHLEADPNGHQWLRLRIDRWSLESLGVPIYPEDRFQLGVAMAIDRRYSLDRRIRVIMLSDSSRFTGERRQKLVAGSHALRIAAETFRFNARPRQHFPQ